MSIPTTHHINLAHTNTMSAAPGFGIEGGLGYHDNVQNNGYTGQLAFRNNINKQFFDQSSSNYNSNPNSKFRVISMHPRGESSYERSNQPYPRNHATNGNPYNIDPNYQYFVSKNSGNSASLPDHQRVTMTQTPSNGMTMNTDELTTFRNLVMRTLQLLARTTSELMKHSPSPVAPTQSHSNNSPSRAEYLGPESGFYGMREDSRSADEPRFNESVSSLASSDFLNSDHSMNNITTTNSTELPETFMNELKIFGMNIGETVDDSSPSNTGDNILPVLPAATLRENHIPKPKAPSDAWNSSIRNVIDPFFK